MQGRNSLSHWVEAEDNEAWSEQDQVASNHYRESKIYSFRKWPLGGALYFTYKGTFGHLPLFAP